jgi:hypothetical protein
VQSGRVSEYRGTFVHSPRSGVAAEQARGDALLRAPRSPVCHCPPGRVHKALRCAVSRGSLVRLRPGVFAIPIERAADRHVAARQELAITAVAAVLANPSAAASPTAAAVLLGLPVWYLADLPCVTVPPRFVGDVAGTHLHRAQMPPGHLGAGSVTTAVARTVIDIGREHGALSAVVAADAALSTGQVSLAVLRARLHDCRLARCAGRPPRDRIRRRSIRVAS